MTTRLSLGPVGLVVAAALLGLSAYLLFGGLAASWVTAGGLMNEGGRAVGRDFTMFWSASVLALEGNAASVYDFGVMRDLQGLLTGVPDPAYPVWLYPPTGLLFVAPASLLPYRAALILWSLVGVASLAAVLWHVTRDPVVTAALLLFPAVALCLINGQTGLFLAGLVGGGLLLLDRRPWLAGLLLGIATVKPQMLLLAVPCLVLGRHGRAVAGMAATFVSLAALSALVFGIAPWSAFVTNVLGGVDILANVRPLERMPSVLVAGSLAGLDRGAAVALQVASALGALAIAGWLWARRRPIAIRGSALLFGLPFATPYAFDYDLAVLTVAVGWLAVEAARRGWLRGEKLALALLWVSPIAGWLIARRTGVLLTPAVLAACLIIVLRADRRSGASA